MTSTALITGSSQGLGLTLVNRFLAEGWIVHGFSRSVQSLVHERFIAHVVDVTNETEVQAAVRNIANSSCIDLLICNAGIASMNALLLTPAKTAERLMRVNYMGTFHCLQAVGKVMLRRRRGRIVNVTTVAVPLSLEGEAAYVASKAAVEALTRVAACELRSSGIIVSAVGFGPFDTNLTRAVPKVKLAEINTRIGLKQSPSKEEVADFLIAHTKNAQAGQIDYFGNIPIR